MILFVVIDICGCLMTVFAKYFLKNQIFLCFKDDNWMLKFVNNKVRVWQSSIPLHQQNLPLVCWQNNLLNNFSLKWYIEGYSKLPYLRLRQHASEFCYQYNMGILTRLTCDTAKVHSYVLLSFSNSNFTLFAVKNVAERVSESYKWSCCNCTKPCFRKKRMYLSGAHGGAY